MNTPAVDVPPDVLTLVQEWLNVPEVAAALGVDVTRVRQLLRDGQLLAVRHAGVLAVPARFISGDRVLKGLPGTLTLLADAGFDPAEALRWLFTVDESLPGSPVQALAEDRGTEVRRRAQALAL